MNTQPYREDAHPEFEEFTSTSHVTGIAHTVIEAQRNGWTLCAYKNVNVPSPAPFGPVVQRLTFRRPRT